MSRDLLRKRLPKRLGLVAVLGGRLKTLPALFPPGCAAAAAAIAVTLLGASCGHKTLTSHRDGGDATGGAVGDAREAASESGSEVTCTKAMRSEQEGLIRAAAAAAAPCFNGTVFVLDGRTDAVRTTGAGSARVCAEGGAGSRESEWSSQVARAVAGLDASCLCYSEVPNAICLPLAVSGGAGTQIQQISNALATCGGPAEINQPFQITLDDSGRIAGTTGILADVSDCLVRALGDLTFPCLAGAGVCGSFGEWLDP